VVIRYIFPFLVCLEQEKSGNPDEETRKKFLSLPANSKPVEAENYATHSAPMSTHDVSSNAFLF
jgi:hypothetical protein